MTQIQYDNARYYLDLYARNQFHRTPNAYANVRSLAHSLGLDTTARACPNITRRRLDQLSKLCRAK